MSLADRDRNALGAISAELAAADPDLAAFMALFSRLAADDAMPAIEQIRGRAGRRRSQARRSQARRSQARRSQARRRKQPLSRGVMARPGRARRAAAWPLMIVWLVMAVSLIATGTALSTRAGPGSCQAGQPVSAMWLGRPAAGCASAAPKVPPRPGRAG
jgi:hypothetical protein